MTNQSRNPRDTEPGARFLAATPRLEIHEETRRIALLLQLDEADIANSGILEKLTSIGFTPKTEFHVTAVDIKQGSAIADAFDRQDETDKATVIHTLEKAEASSWQIRSRDEFYLVEKQYDEEDEPRKSIVQIVDCPELKGLYAELGLFTPDGTQHETPPAHITLATQGSTRGIGIGTLDELHALGTPFTVPA